MGHMLGSRAIRNLFVLFFVAGLLAGCSGGGQNPADGPVVLELKGSKLTLRDLQLQYDRATGVGTFDTAPADKREEFLNTLANKEILLATARERFGKLTPDEEKSLRLTADTKLLKGLEFTLLKPVYADTVTPKRMLAKFNRQILCDWIVTDSDSLSRVARAEIAAGRPFAEVAAKYSKADKKQVVDGHIPWTTGEQMGRDFGNELFVTDREPGYLSEVRPTMRGFELFQVRAYRDYDLSKDRPGSMIIPSIIEGIRTHARLSAWSDSIGKARGFEVTDDGAGVLFKGMTPYWDSLKAFVAQTHQKVPTFKPPVSDFTAEQLKTPLLRVGGKTTTIGEFLSWLPDYTPKMWPNASDRASFTQQINSIALMRLELQAAREMGVDKMPTYLLECRMDREKIYLDKLQEGVSKDLPAVTAEDVKAYYDAHQDTYTMKDRMHLSYMVFPTRAGAERFFALSADSSSDWWTSQCAEYALHHPEVKVVSNSPQLDTNNPPEELKGLVEKARDLKVNDKVGPTPTGSGWGVARVAYNEHAGMQPIEKVESGIRRLITQDRIDAAMQKLIDDGRERYRVKAYPEKLKPKA